MGWKTKGLRFARPPWLGLLRARRGESPSVLSSAHHRQLSHWSSLQSFLLLHFSARKIPHPPSGCRKRSYSLWMCRHQKQRGDCGAGGDCGLRASVPGHRWQHPGEPALPAHGPAGFANPNTARCVTSSTSSHGDLPGPPANGLCCPTSFCLSGFWQGASHTLLFLVFPSPGWLPSSAGAYRSLGSCRAVVASTALVAPVRVTRGSALTFHPSHPKQYSMIAELGTISQGGFKPWIFQYWLNTANAASDGGSASILPGDQPKTLLTDPSCFLPCVPCATCQAHVEGGVILRRPQASWVRQPMPGSPTPGLSIALGKGNTGTDWHGFAQLSGQLLQTKALLRSCFCKGDKKRPDIPKRVLPHWGGNRRALLALGKVAFAIKQPQSALGSTSLSIPSLQWLIGHLDQNWHQHPSQSHNPNTILPYQCHASLEASHTPPCASLAKLLPLCLVFSHLKLLVGRLSSKTMQKIKERKLPLTSIPYHICSMPILTKTQERTGENSYVSREKQTSSS